LAVVTRSPVVAADASYDPLFAQCPLPAFMVDPDLRIGPPLIHPGPQA